MNKKTLTTIMVLGAILAFIIYTFIIIMKPEPIIIQGEVEAQQFNISSKVPGRIQELAVDKGQTVKKGDLIFAINSVEIEAKLDEANAAYLAASAQNSKAINGAQDEDIAAAYSAYLASESAALLAENTYNRVKNLYEQGVVPAQKRDEAETNMTATRESANARKSIWQKAVNGARDEDKIAAAALVERANAAIDQVKSYLDETTIYALSDGEISGINAEEGELVPTGFPVVNIIDMDDIWVAFFIREDYLDEFKMGSTFVGSLPALGEQEYEFKVSYISSAGDFARWNATKTSGEFDLKSFEIEARPVKKIEGLRPGMSVVVNLSNSKHNG